jgi:hypothetical protein
MLGLPSLLPEFIFSHTGRCRIGHPSHGQPPNLAWTQSHGQPPNLAYTQSSSRGVPGTLDYSAPYVIYVTCRKVKSTGIEVVSGD